MEIDIVHPDVLTPPEAQVDRRVVAYVADLQRGGGRRPHLHDRAQFLAVTSGSIAVLAEGFTFVAPPERAVWVPANTLHETRHLASTRLRTLYVDADACSVMPKRTTVVQISPLMRELLTAIIALPRDYEEGGSDERLMEVLLDQIAASRELPLNLPIPTSRPLLDLATSIIDRPAEALSVESAATSLGVSARTLERQFKRETGLSLRSFRHQAKLLKALELLSARTPVSRISDLLGFGEPSAFIAMFRAAYGVTPGRYLSQK
jgi:AraC-like DNA-binding protein/mannose-6-phosphate isomerase-like protein (cupin superfamily)